MEIEEVAKSNKHRCGGEETSIPSAEFLFQWGNHKRLRCMKLQIKNDSTTEKTRVRIDRGVVRANKDSFNHGNVSLGQPLLHPPPLPQRTLRNSESSSVMKGHRNGFGSSFSPDKKGNNIINKNGVGGSSASSETAQDSKKGGSSSGSEAIPVWLPKFVIALTNKEKEEDFMAIKGSRLPLRPKKRAKFVQRTLNLVSPGSWLCDLTIERYEVREKQISKKRPRGLKAMGNVDSDSE